MNINFNKLISSYSNVTLLACVVVLEPERVHVFGGY